MNTATKELKPARLLSQHRSRRIPLRRGVILVLFGILDILIPLIYGYTRYNVTYAQYGPVLAQQRALPWYALALCGLLFFTWLVAVLFLRSYRWVAVHANGLMLHLGAPRFIPWEQLAGISCETIDERFLFWQLSSRCRARLYPTTGKPLSLDSTLEDLAGLVEQVKAAIYPRLRPAMQAGLAADSWLYFGSLSVHNRMLRVDEAELPWDQVQRLAVDHAVLHVEDRSGAVHRVPAIRIPNLDLCLDLIRSRVNL